MIEEERKGEEGKGEEMLQTQCLFPGCSLMEGQVVSDWPTWVVK